MKAKAINSLIFWQAFDLQNRHTSKAIELYTIEVTEIDPENFIAWNNLGCCKIHLGKETKDIELIKAGENDIKRSVKVAQQVGESYYSYCENNLEWAKTEIANFNNQPGN